MTERNITSHRSRFAYGLVVVAIMLALCLPAVALVPPAVPQGAVGESAYDASNATVEARLLIDGEAATPGVPIRMGVLFRMDPGWHIYWRNSGDSGIPTRTDWNVAGASLGEIEWPAPQVFSESDGLITTYGYDGEVLLAREVVFRPGEVGIVGITVDVEFIVCKIGCIPGEISLARQFEVVDAAAFQAQTNPIVTALFDAEGARVPVQPEQLGLQIDVLYSQTAIRPGDEFKAAIVATACTDADKSCTDYFPRAGAATAHGSQWTFIPDVIESVDLKVSGQRQHPFYDHGFLVTLKGSAWPEDPGESQRLRGLLAVLNSEQELRTVEVDLPLPRARAEASVDAIANPFLDPDPDAPARPQASGGQGETGASPRSTIGLLYALLFAFLGGVVLNGMPCVLPVLAIKVFGAAELASRSRRELLSHGLAYTGGILISMFLLAGVVSALRSAGTAVGWGFQFQEPIFVATVSAVLVVFALNLFGVFEISFDSGRLGSVGQGAAGSRRSFFEGLLAVVLATPCSAPFLGTAVGFAFASPAVVIFAIFGAVGLGLASPYLLVTAIPGWARVLPRPGAWMMTLRRVLGVALLATVVWLLWVAGQVAGEAGLWALVVFLAAVAVATWMAGTLQAAGKSGQARTAALLASLLAVVSMPMLPFDRSDASPAVAESGGDAPNSSAAHSHWQNFDPARVAAAVASGQPVFVSFSADWCITCKLNERVVLADEVVIAEFAKLGVATFKADWTRRDELIRSELARFGRAGVPMYLVYAPDRPGEPELLPELLTVDRVLTALRDAAGSRSARVETTSPAGA